MLCTALISLATDDTPLAWILAGAGIFALIGLLFGAAVYWFGGRGSGRFGSAVVDSLGPLPERTRRTVACGFDGALFLGLVGLVLGLIAGPRGLIYGLIGLGFLILGTFIFAGLAHNLSGRRNRTVTAVCSTLIGAMVGAVVTDGKLVGAAAGSLAGLAASGLAKPGRASIADAEEDNHCSE